MEKLKKYIGKIILVIIFVILALFQMETNKINEKFLEDMPYSRIAEMARQKYDGYSIEVYPMKSYNYFGKTIVNFFYYIEDSKEGFPIALILHINAGHWGNNEYSLGFEENLGAISEDTVFRDFGGCVSVDKNMKYIPENEYDEEYNEYIEEFMKSYENELQEMVNIVNERWDLGMSCSGIK